MEAPVFPEEGCFALSSSGVVPPALQKALRMACQPLAFLSKANAALYYPNSKKAPTFAPPTLFHSFFPPFFFS